MSGANNILPFGQGGGANVQSQISYAGDAQRPIGNQPGDARSSFVNKILRQCAVMAAGLGQFTADNQGADVDDTLTPSGMRTLIEAALAGYLATQQGADQDVSSVSAGYVRFPGGFMLQWVRGVSDINGDLSLVLPQAFSSVIVGGLVNEGEAAGWTPSNATIWGFDYLNTTLTVAAAKVRNVTGAVVSGVPAITGTIFVWGK